MKSRRIFIIGWLVSALLLTACGRKIESNSIDCPAGPGYEVSVTYGPAEPSSTLLATKMPTIEASLSITPETTELAPTATPTSEPTVSPTSAPTSTPTATPTNTPIAAPMATPTSAPTSTPTATPVPTLALTAIPSLEPTASIKPSEGQDQVINEANLGDTSTIKHMVGCTSKGYKLEIVDGVTYVYDGSNKLLLANKTYKLPSTYVPSGRNGSLAGVNYSNDNLEATTYNQYRAMRKAAGDLGLSLSIGSGYRSYSLQQSVYNNYVKRDGKEKADTYSARPGHSEHQTAICFDLGNASPDFTKTKESKWVNENCYKYGFIIRYPQGKETITGYMYESWHLRYVGVELATKLYNNGSWLTMEEYFGISSKYNY